MKQKAKQGLGKDPVKPKLPTGLPGLFKGLPEDWLALILAFLLILLAAVGVLGKNGISITF